MAPSHGLSRQARQSNDDLAHFKGQFPRSPPTSVSCDIYVCTASGTKSVSEEKVDRMSLLSWSSFDRRCRQR